MGVYRISGVAKDRHVPIQISLEQWPPLAIAIVNKRQVVHTYLGTPYFHCKSADDIDLSSIITSLDLSSFNAFYLICSIM